MKLAALLALALFLAAAVLAAAENPAPAAAPKKTSAVVYDDGKKPLSGGQQKAPQKVVYDEQKPLKDEQKPLKDEQKPLKVDEDGDGPDEKDVQKLKGAKREGDKSFIFSTRGIMVKTVVRKYTAPAPDDKCKRDAIFVIDNSGSMERYRAKMFAGLNAAIETLRQKGESRISTVLFSDSPAVYGPSRSSKRGFNARPTTQCFFCWTKSNAHEQPFPNPNKMRGGTLTDLTKGLDLALDHMRKDLASGKRADKDGRYMVVLLSDLLQTTGVSSPDSAAFRRFEDRIMSSFCNEDWKKFLKRDKQAGGYKLKPKHAGKASEVCKGAIAELKYFYFHRANKNAKVASDAIKKLNTKSVKDLKSMDKAWAEAQREQWNSRKTSSKYKIQRAMYDLLAGQAKMGGAVYHAQTTSMLHINDDKSAMEWKMIDFVQALLGDECKPLEFEYTSQTVDVKTPELPELKLHIDPVSRHFPNDKTKINPNYENSLGRDSPHFFSEQLARFRDDVAAFRQRVVDFETDLDEQMADLEAAAKTDGHLRKKVTEARAKVEAAKKSMRKVAAEKMQEALKEVKFHRLYVGGFASTRGTNAVHNMMLSTKRARGAYCMLEGAFKKLGVSDYSVVVGYFGHQWHCKEVLKAVAAPKSLGCGDVAKVEAAAQEWVSASPDDETREARKLTLLRLEDDARRGEIHFEQQTALDVGFKTRCCVERGSGSCAPLTVCAEGTWGQKDFCSKQELWRTGWTPQDQQVLDQEINVCATLIREVETMTGQAITVLKAPFQAGLSLSSLLLKGAQ